MNQPQMEPITSENKIVLYWLFISQFIYICSLAAWFPMALLSVMAFDSPRSYEYIWTSVFVYGVWSYPLWLIIFSLISWVLFKKRKYTRAAFLTSLPILSGVSMITVQYFFQII